MGTTLDDVELTLWKDNKVVSMLSTFAGKEPEPEVRRYDRKTKTIRQIKCPAVIGDYNKHMGGVDLMDSFIGRYRITIKSRKWYIRIFHHLLDMTCINSWLLYKKACHLKGVKGINRDRNCFL